MPPFRLEGLLEFLMEWLCPGAAALTIGLIGYAVWLQTISPLRGGYLILVGRSPDSGQRGCLRY